MKDRYYYSIIFTNIIFVISLFIYGFIIYPIQHPVYHETLCQVSSVSYEFNSTLVHCIGNLELPEFNGHIDLLIGSTYAFYYHTSVGQATLDKLELIQ